MTQKQISRAERSQQDRLNNALPVVDGGRCRAAPHARAYGVSRSFNTASSSWRTCARSCSVLRVLSPA